MLRYLVIINVRDGVFRKSCWNISQNGRCLLKIKWELIRHNPGPLVKVPSKTHLDIEAFYTCSYKRSCFFFHLHFSFIFSGAIEWHVRIFDGSALPNTGMEWSSLLELQRSVRVATCQELVREKSGNFILSQGKLTFWRKVRGNLKSFNTLKEGKIIWGHCDLNGVFP